MKKGRPTVLNKAKNRVHAIILDEVSEGLWRKISTARGKSNWLHEYVSEHIKRDFLPNLNESMLKQKLIDIQKRRDGCEKELVDVANELSKLRLQEHQKQINKEMKIAGLKEVQEYETRKTKEIE